MSGCNATLHSVECNDHEVLAELPHGNPIAGMRWTDDAPGAKPHTPPRWTAERFEFGDVWQVVRPESAFAAAKYFDVHPDPEGAAEAEAAWLNGWRALDKDKIGDYVETIKVRLERDRLRAALEKIARHADGSGRLDAISSLPHRSPRPTVREYARSVLEGVR